MARGLLGQGTSFSLGRIAGIPILLDASWFVIAAVLAVLVAPVAESSLPGLGANAYLVGLAFAVLLYASVFLHELAHALTGKALGLRVNSITITLFGGLAQLSDDDPRPSRDALVAVVGPIASLVIGGAAWLAARPFEGGLVRFLLLELALASTFVAAFNLLPTLPLDGGHLLKDAIWAVRGRPGPGYVVAGSAGYVLAALMLAFPWVVARPASPQLLSVLWSAAIAWFLFSGARRAVAYGHLLDRLPKVSATALVRPAVTVTSDLPLAEAVRRAEALGAAAVVIVDADGRPLAVVDEDAAGAVPLERRPHVPVASVSRRLAPEDTLPATLEGVALLRRLQEAPSRLHVLVDPAGQVAGVLLARDVNAVLAA